MLRFKHKIKEEHVFIIVLVMVISLAMYWFIPMNLKFRKSINTDNIDKIAFFRWGYSDRDYDIDVTYITNKEKIKEALNYINHIYCTKKFKSMYSLKSKYQYIIGLVDKENNITISIDNTVVSISTNGRIKQFNIKSKENILEHLDSIFT